MLQRQRTGGSPPPATAASAAPAPAAAAAPANSEINAQCPVVGPNTTPPWPGFDRGVLARATAARTGPNPADLEGYGNDGHHHDPNPLARQPSTAPRVAETQERSLFGVDVRGTGVSPDAMNGASAVAAALFGHREDIQERLAEADVQFVVIPSDRSLPEVPGLEGMANTCTTDGLRAPAGTGRNWNDVRGSGGTRVGDGWIVSMPEEGLVDVTDGTPWALNEDYHGYGPNHSVAVHEAAHILHTQGLGEEERARITEIYQARKRAGLEFGSDYAGSNELEYFAEAVNAYLGVNSQITDLRADELAEHSPEWLQRHDPEMFGLLGGILGSQEEALDRARAQLGPAGAPAATPAPAPVAAPAVS